MLCVRCDARWCLVLSRAHDFLSFPSNPKYEVNTVHCVFLRNCRNDTIVYCLGFSPATSSFTFDILMMMSLVQERHCPFLRKRKEENYLRSPFHTYEWDDMTWLTKLSVSLSLALCLFFLRWWWSWSYWKCSQQQTVSFLYVIILFIYIHIRMNEDLFLEMDGWVLNPLSMMMMMIESQKMTVNLTKKNFTVQLLSKDLVLIIVKCSWESVIVVAIWVAYTRSTLFFFFHTKAKSFLDASTTPHTTHLSYRVEVVVYSAERVKYSVTTTIPNLQ